MLVVNRVKAIIKENIFLGNSNFKGVCIRTNTTPKDSLLEFNYFGNLSDENIETARDFVKMNTINLINKFININFQGLDFTRGLIILNLVGMVPVNI